MSQTSTTTRSPFEPSATSLPQRSVSKPCAAAGRQRAGRERDSVSACWLVGVDDAQRWSQLFLVIRARVTYTGGRGPSTLDGPQVAIASDDDERRD